MTGQVRPILQWPDPRLRRAAAPVGAITDEIRAIWHDMIATMRAMPGSGVGLAAPQIGVMLRLAVIDASTTADSPIRLADPEVLEAAPSLSTHPEASPCLPGLHAEIRRPPSVLIGFTDVHGARVSQRFEGLWATSVQHQIDHLNGRMYFDNLSRLKRDRLLKRAQKAR